MADHPGGGQGRPLLRGVVRHPSRRTNRPRDAGRVRGDVLGRRRNRVVDPGTGLAAASLAANGTPEQLGEWVPQMFGTPRSLLASFCSSEPGAGSDVGAILTRAGYDEANDEWVLNGVKTWATNGGIANVHIVVASVDPELGSRGQATFIIPPNTPGFNRDRSTRNTASGLRTPPRCARGCPDPRSSDCRRQGQVRRASRPRPRRPKCGRQAGDEDVRGTRPQSARWRSGWPAQRMSTRWSTHCSENVGRKIADYQAIAFKLADMKSRIDASRLLVWRAGWMARNGKPSPTLKDRWPSSWPARPPST